MHRCPGSASDHVGQLDTAYSAQVSWLLPVTLCGAARRLVCDLYCVILWVHNCVRDCEYLFSLCLTKSYIFLLSGIVITLLPSINQILFIYLDIRKAFDTVSHAKRLSKLWDAGIIGNLWSFFKAYLSNRQQCVVVANNKSNWYAVTSGVPQGTSILGPLLFIFFINDLSLIPSFSTPYFFADDTKCCTKILSLSDSSRLQEDLNLINSWSSHSGLTFNISKSCLLRFYNRSTSTIDATYPISVNQISLP